MSKPSLQPIRPGAPWVPPVAPGVPDAFAEFHGACGYSGQGGFHRGVLAGLSEEERERAKKAKLEELFQQDELSGGEFSAENVLKSRCRNGEPVDNLRAVLVQSVADDSDWFLDKGPALVGAVGKMMGRDPRDMTKDEVIDAIIAVFSSRRDDYGEMAATCSEGEFRALREVSAAGDRVAFKTDEAAAHRGWGGIDPLCLAFFHDDVFTFVIPEELREGVAALDWGAVERERSIVGFVEHAIDVLTCFCGIVRLDDAYDQFCRWYPAAGLTRDEFTDRLVKLEPQLDLFGLVIDDPDDPGRILDPERPGAYVVNGALDLDLDDACAADADGDPRALDQVFGRLRDLAAYHREYAMRDFEPELAEQDPLDWVLARPPYVKLCNWFDTHVPAGAVDEFYADRMVEEVALAYMNGEADAAVFEMLEEKGAFPAGEAARELRSLVTLALASTPMWETNGMSGVEAKEAKTGRRQFFNDDGTPMVVGRNDPCPCGSGKKYKKCCGRL